MNRATLGFAVAGLLVAGAPVARGADALPATAPSADPDFLEYLGSWDGSDADWQVMAADGTAPRPAASANEPKTKPAPNMSSAGADGGAAKQEQQR